MAKRRLMHSAGALAVSLVLSAFILGAVIIGGRVGGTVTAATGDLGSWTATTPLTTPTWAFAAAAGPGYVYISGGEVSGGTNLTGTLRSVINSDGSLGAWQAQTDLSTARIDHGMVYTETATNRCLYAVGGYTSQSEGVTASVEYARVGSDGTIGAWSQGSPMNTARAHFGVAAYGNRIYALGGSSTGGSATDLVEFASMNGDCSLGAWQATTAMTATHSGNRAFAANGFLYSTGDMSSTLATGVQYAPVDSETGQAGQWSATSHMSQKRADHAVVASTRAGFAYAFGGVSLNPFTSTASVERATLNANGTLGPWAQVTALPAASEGMAFAQANGRVYLLGGTSAGITSTVLFSAIEGAGVPDLSKSSKQVNASGATPGQTITYTVVVSNTGSGPANARVTDTLPVSVTFVTGSASSGATFDSASRSIRWSGVVSASTAISFTYRAVITSPMDNGLLITNTASVDDGNGAVMETAPVTTTISSSPDLSTSRLTVNRPMASPGGRINYSMVVSNTGTMNTPARVTDTLPISLTYVGSSLQSTMGTSVYDSNSGSILWAGPALAGVPVTISYQALTPAGAASGTVITNSATVQAGGSVRETTPVTVTVVSNPSRIGWENLGLYGIRAGDIAIDPNSGTVYVANGGSVGVYRTVNEGEAWLPSANVSGCLRLLFNQSTGAIYASCSPGADQSGLWKSTDNGLTWNPILNKALVPAKRDGPVTAVAMSGSSLYVADGNAPEAPGPAIWVSTDAGVTWTRKTIAPSGGVNAVAADASNPAVVYVATATNVYRSADSGVNWADITPTGGADFKVVATSPLTTSIIFVASGYDGGLKVYKSSNSGQSWSTVYAPSDPRETPITTINFHPSDPNKMYSEIGESTDAGETWHFWPAGAGGRGMAIHPLNPSIIYGRHTLGVRRSSDGGVTWTNINTGLEEVSIKGVAENPRDPNNYLIASAMGFGSTFDNGKSWNWPLDMSAMPQPDMFGEAVALEPSVAYLSGGDSILGRSTDGGRTWGVGNLQQVIQNDLTLAHRPEVAELRLVPGETGHLLAAVRENSETNYVPKGGVYESNDGGLTWAATGLTGVPVNTIDLGQTSGRTVIYAGVGNWRATSAGPGGIYTSTVDNTSIWSQTNVTSTAPTILRIRLDPTNPLVAYAGGRSQLASRFGRPDLFKTTDGGATWLGILTEIQANASTMPIRAVAIDPAFPANVFYASSNNVYQSADGGSTWSLLSDSNLGFEWINTLIVPLSAPSPANAFTATSSGNQAVLSWTNPADSDLSGVTIKYSTQGFPMLSTDGITLTSASAAAGSTGVYTHTGVVTGTTYYYSIFSQSQAGRYSVSRQAAVQPGTTLSSPSVAELLPVRAASGPARRPAVEASSSRSIYAAAGSGLFAKEMQTGASSGTRIYVPLVPREFAPGW